MVRVLRTPDVVRRTLRDSDVFPSWMLGAQREEVPYRPGRVARRKRKLKKKLLTEQQQNQEAEYAPPPPVESLDDLGVTLL